MSRVPDEPLTFRTLYESHVVSVREYRCRAGQGGPASEEQSDFDNIVLLRHGVFSRHVGGRRVTADVNQTSFFSRGSTYRVSHPGDCGDCGTILEAAPRVLSDVIRALDQPIDAHPERPFPFVSGPCDSGAYLRHRELVMRLTSTTAGSVDPLWADVAALQLVADVLEAAFERHGLPKKPRRRGTEKDHHERIEAARTYLSTRLSERVTLDEVSRAVHVSPFHFARLFQERTGVSVHRYLTRLRLRASLERLVDGVGDLSSLALALGFSSHSHFADAFRREFGRAPSEVRRAASARTIREMRKNLEV